MDLIDIIEKHWSLMLGVVGIITAFVRMESAIKTLSRKDTEIEKKVCDIEKEVKTMNPIWVEIKERLARIETSLSIHFKDK